MIRSASSQASYGGSTRRPWASAFGRLLLASGRPTRTSTPESRRDNAWACPWLPKPRTATLRPWIRERSASLSYNICAGTCASSGKSGESQGIGWSDGPNGLRPFGPGVAISHRPVAAAEGDQSRLHQLTDAVRLEELEQRGQFGRTAGGFDRDHLGGQVDRLGAEQPDDLDQLASGLRRGPDLHQDQLAADRALLQFDDLEHLHQLVELLGDLFEHNVLDGHGQGDPGHVGVLGGADRQRLDVVAPPGDQAGHPGQYAGLVLHQDAERMSVHVSHAACSSRAVVARPGDRLSRTPTL